MNTLEQTMPEHMKTESGKPQKKNAMKTKHKFVCNLKIKPYFYFSYHKSTSYSAEDCKSKKCMTKIRKKDFLLLGH